MHIMSAEIESVAERTAKPRRRVHSEALKRELVERSLLPGASVAALAMEHGINANLLFAWRRAHPRATASPVPAERASSGGGSAALAPVEVMPEATPGLAMAATAPAIRPGTPAGTIEIEVAGTRVRLRGAVDETSLRSVLAALRSSGA